MTEDFQKQLQNIFQSIYSNEYIVELYKRIKTFDENSHDKNHLFI